MVPKHHSGRARDIGKEMMKSILDSHSWFLERIAYHDALEIHILEGVRSAAPQQIQIAGVDLGEGYATDITENSRRVLVVFENIAAYQVTNESYTTADEYEIGTKGVLRKYDRSHYLDFVRRSTLINSLLAHAYTHFRLVLVDDVIDVIAKAGPRIEQQQS